MKETANEGLAREVRRYESGAQTGWGPRVWMGMFRGLWRSRELVWRLFMRDFTARYRQTVLGVGWALIMPLVAVGTFAFLNKSGVVTMGPIGIPYLAYAIVGLTAWQVFAGGLTACCDAIINGYNMVVTANFPKETLVIASLGQTLVEFLVRLALTAVVFAYYGILPPAAALLFPFAILPLAFLTLGVGLMLSLLNALLRDVANVVTLLTTFLLFVTPVLYPAPASGALAVFTRYNPLAALIAGARDLVVSGRIEQPAQFAWASVLSAVVFLASWRVFKLAEPRMAERVGAR